MIAELLREEWEKVETAPAPGRPTLTGAAWKIINELPPESRAGADDRRLSEQLDAGILAILDPGVLRKMGNRLAPGGKPEWWDQGGEGQVHNPRPVQPGRRPGGKSSGSWEGRTPERWRGFSTSAGRPRRSGTRGRS